MIQTQTTVIETSRRRAPGPKSRFGARNLLHFARNQLSFLRELADAYGDVAHIKLFGGHWFLVSHPDEIENLLVKQARIMGRDDYATVLERALGLGLLTNDGESWKRQRRLMAQAFVPKRIQSYGEAMVRVTEAGLSSWKHGDEKNLHEEMSRITMEVVADVLFGAGVGQTDGETVREAMEVINEFFANSPEAILKLAPWVPTPRNRRMTRAVAQIDELIYRIIAQRRAGDARDDLLGTLLAAQDDDGAKMSDRQLRDEAVTLFLAGHETTALALAHTLFLLSTHPDVERKLHAELSAVLAGRRPSAADVKALPYTERVLKESMRLFPPAWTTGREALEAVDVGGYRIPKGAQILVSQWVVHRDPRWFPNPEGFDPDRWLPERAKDLPRFAYFPFGGGPRVCIGNHFAMMEATLLLAVIAQRWQIELLPGQRLELKPSVTLRQKGPGLRVRLAERAERRVQGEAKRPSAANASAENPAVGLPTAVTTTARRVYLRGHVTLRPGGDDRLSHAMTTRAPAEPVRLSKRVVELTRCSRTEAEQYVEGGWVRVDGVVVEKPQTLVGEGARVEIIPGARPGRVEPATIALHRGPAGDDVAPSPDRRWPDDPTGVRLLQRHFVRQQAIFPLARGESGLVIFTQDARLVTKMQEEASRVEQERVVEVSGEPPPDALARLAHGMSYRGRALPPIKVSWQSELRLRFATRSIEDGQIEAMCAEVGLAVIGIRRLRIGRISLAKMPVGSWRYLRAAERI